MGLTKIRYSMDSCALESPQKLKEMFDQGEAGFLKRYYQFAKETNDLFTKRDPDWERSHNYVDPWGHPYRIKITSQTTNEYRISIWSCGPNGEDETGSGDDVALESFIITVKPVPRVK